MRGVDRKKDPADTEYLGLSAGSFAVGVTTDSRRPSRAGARCQSGGRSLARAALRSI